MHQSSSQNIGAKNLIIKRRRANNPKPEVTIDLTKYTKEICDVTNEHEPEIWMEGDIYKLYKSDRDVLLSPTAWLNDNIICAAQNILKQQMPLLQGLQVPSLGQTCSFDIIKQPFLQILHNGQGHWLLISTVGTKDSEVHVYDSIYQSVNIKVKEQIASLLYTQEKEIKLKCMNIQKQSGSNDCGIFAVANATLLSLGINPGKYLMNQGLMRSHLYECFIEGKMTIFPWIKERRDKEKFREDTIKVYCKCRMPDSSIGDMVACSECKHWYHVHWVTVVPKEALEDKKVRWMCEECQEKIR